MKISICLLTCGRPDMTYQTWEHNLAEGKAGHPYKLFWLDNGSSEEDFGKIFDYAQRLDVHWFEYEKENTGIAQALNKLMIAAFEDGADAVFTMANDILEPDDFLKMRIEAWEKIPNTGVVAIPLQGSHRYSIQNRDGIRIDVGRVIGNYLITRDCFDKIGLMCTDYGIYGPIDLDYCDRANLAGLLCYYLSDQKGDHIGHPKNNPTEYQQAKMASLQPAWQIYARNGEQYRNGERLFQWNFENA